MDRKRLLTVPLRLRSEWVLDEVAIVSAESNVSGSPCF